MNTLARNLSSFMGMDGDHLDRLIAGGCTNRVNDPTKAQRRDAPEDLERAYSDLGATGLARREGVGRRTVYNWLERAGVTHRLMAIPSAQPRPCPNNFREVFVMRGWAGASEVFNADHRLIRRWLNASGRDGIILARSLVLNRNKGGTKRRLSEETKVTPEVATAAARYLQRHFRPVHSLAVHHKSLSHMFQVGGKTMTDLEMVKLARKRGWGK